MHSPVMRTVEIYTTPFCGYCSAAKRFLAKKGVPFSEIDVAFDPEGREAMTTRAGGRHSVPQIFIGETHVGGYNELVALDREGRLEPLLVA